MKSCGILFLAINARYTHSNPALLYLRNNIDLPDSNISVLEFSSGENEGKIAEKIKSFKPDILALSVYIWNTVKVRKLLKVVKSELPGIKIVLGGPEVSFNSRDWINQFEEISYIITGAGEESFRKLAASGFISDSRIITGSNPHFSLIKFPYNSEDMKRLSGKYIYYESSRGCPFKCTYCLSSETESHVEFRKPDQIRDELDFFSVHNPVLIKFVDRTFNLNRDHFRPVWEYIVKKFSGGQTRFHFEVFPDLLDPDDLDFLSRVPRGLFQFEMGIQSTLAETLKEIKRPGLWEKAEAYIRALVSMGNINLHTDLIAGLPFEKFTDFRQSFNRVYSLGAEHFQAGFLKILPGTGMYRKTEEYGIEYNNLPPYEIIKNKWINSSDLAKLKLIGELVDLVYNSGKFSETGKLLVSIYGSAFNFYERTAGIFKKEHDASHRNWEYAAGIFRDMIKKDSPENIPLLTDHLRWDWCKTMKAHHYPEILKSELTLNAKRKGYRFFTDISVNKKINYRGLSFDADDLRKSIFFIPETAVFSEKNMKDKMALFLPDKTIVYFNPDSYSA